MNDYITLELPPTASLSEIKSAYRKLVKKYHPDSYKMGYPDGYKEKLVQVQKAYFSLLKIKKIKETEFVNPRDKMPEYSKNTMRVHVHKNPQGVRTGTYVNGKLVR